MKGYLRQFYNEGLATTFYLKPINYVNKKIKNEKIRKILCFLIWLCYTVFVLLFAVIILYNNWPF